MALSPGVTEARKFLAHMDPDAASLKKENPEAHREALALAATLLAAAWEMYEVKAKYVVVGQLYYKDGHYLKPFDPQADRVALGPYGTERTAKDALVAASWAGGKPHQEFRTWVLPYSPLSPAAFHKARREAVEAEQAKATGNPAQRLSARLVAEQEATPLCPLTVFNDDLDEVPCVRHVGPTGEHPGHCFESYPESWGMTVTDGSTPQDNKQDKDTA